jgi:predicted MFS family arabinose efflux permease
VPHETVAGSDAGGSRLLVPIGIFALMIGAGAGLVIPFMNLYFATRFNCSAAQIGLFFSVAMILTAAAALIGPVIARSFGNLRTAIGSQLLSLPFLVSLGAERQLGLAVGAFWIRATLMQAATPLLQSLIMQEVPPQLRARSTSVLNLLWNIGWALSSTASGRIIQRFGYAVPFYVTAVLYAVASVYFYRAFSPAARARAVPGFVLTEEAKGARGEGPLSE